jgi:hypothetical protein
MPNMQPEIGNGMNASWDSSTNSFVVSNDSPSWIWLKIFGRVDTNDQNIYYYFFQEVEWNGSIFIDKEGGVKLNQDNQTKGPKAFPMPFIFDRKDANQMLNDHTPEYGCIVPALSMGVDPLDGREIFYFWCGTNPNNRYFIRIDEAQGGGPVMYNSKYSATVCSINPYANPVVGAGGNAGNVWAIEQNGSPLLPGKVYQGFAVGYWNPGNPINPNALDYNDERPLVLCIKQGSSGPNAIKVVTNATNNGGSLVFSYATFCPDEYTAILYQQSQSLRLTDLLDTPKNYGNPNQLLATNGSGAFYYINSSNVGVQWPTPPQTGSSLIVISQSGVYAGSQGISNANMSLDITGSYVNGITIKLKNDMENPGANMYYGTDSNGVRGWYPLP